MIFLYGWNIFTSRNLSYSIIRWIEKALNFTSTYLNIFQPNNFLNVSFPELAKGHSILHAPRFNLRLGSCSNHIEPPTTMHLVGHSLAATCVSFCPAKVCTAHNTTTQRTSSRLSTACDGKLNAIKYCVWRENQTNYAICLVGFSRFYYYFFHGFGFERGGKVCCPGGSLVGLEVARRRFGVSYVALLLVLLLYHYICK